MTTLGTLLLFLVSRISTVFWNQMFSKGFRLTVSVDILCVLCQTVVLIQ